MLLDTAPRLLPGLDPRLSKTADQVLRRRGVQVRTGQSVTQALDGHVMLSTKLGEGADVVPDLVRRGPRRPAGGRTGAED
jgi:NADH dehydrogenase FAD-containing subunit